MQLHLFIVSVTTQLDQTHRLLLHRKEQETGKEGRKGGKVSADVEPEGDAPENETVLERHPGLQATFSITPLWAGRAEISSLRLLHAGKTRERKTFRGGSGSHDEDRSHGSWEDAEQQVDSGEEQSQKHQSSCDAY